MRFKAAVKHLAPPLLAKLYAARFSQIRFTGEYTTWAAAQAASRGYAASEILQHVHAAARLVKQGGAAFERDGVAFPHPDYVWPVVAALLRTAIRCRGELSVLDIGGSLGSTYFQHRRLLDDVRRLRWTVVEQPEFVELGRREFATSELSFSETIEEALPEATPSLVLLSGVLCYVEDPYGMLRKAVETRPDSLVIDRTPLIEGVSDRLRVQRVPPSICRASYPIWLLSREKVLQVLTDAYELAAKIPTRDPIVDGVEFAGGIFDRRRSP